MIHFIRDDRNRTIVDIDATKKDIRCVVVIDTYSRLLLNTPEERRAELIGDFYAIQEIRGAYWEAHNGQIDSDELAKKNSARKSVGSGASFTSRIDELTVGQQPPDVHKEVNPRTRRLTVSSLRTYPGQKAFLGTQAPYFCAASSGRDISYPPCYYPMPRHPPLLVAWSSIPAIFP